MVRANKTLYKSAKKLKEKREEKREEKIDKTTKWFNDYWSGLSESQINKFAEIGYNKDRLLKGYLADNGALGFKAFWHNKDNVYDIQAKLIINSVKKFAKSLFKKNSD